MGSEVVKRFYVRLSGRNCPFKISFLSDAYEYANDGATNANEEVLALDAGFRLTYIQDATNC